MGQSVKRALVVDDEGSLRDIISEVLKILNIESYTAESGAEAIKIASQHSNEIDLMLIDMLMPKMSGGETYKKLKEFLPDMPVIFMSGYVNDCSDSDIDMDDRHKFLQKPFTITKLKNIISTMI